MTPSSKLSVLAAPTSRATSESSSATARAAPLWGTVTLAPAKPSAGIEETNSAKASGPTSIAS